MLLGATLEGEIQGLLKQICPRTQRAECLENNQSQVLAESGFRNQRIAVSPLSVDQIKRKAWASVGCRDRKQKASEILATRRRVGQMVHSLYICWPFVFVFFNELSVYFAVRAAFYLIDLQEFLTY